MIDLIIPAYNAHSTIGYALASVATQLDHDLVKVTIVDDCSDEPYDCFVEQFKSLIDIQVVRLNNNGGPGVARQHGIDITSQPYLTFMDADDVFINVMALRKLRAPLDADENVYLVSAGFYEESETGRVVEHQRDLVWTFGKMYRREYLQRRGIGFNTTRANEDTGFHTKLMATATATDLIQFIPDFVYMWRFRESSITRENDGEYGYNKGFVGYIINKLEALTMPNASPQFVYEHALQTLTECFRTFVNVMAYRPEFKDTVLEYSIRFWKECARPYYYRDAEYTNKVILTALLQKPLRAIPTVTLSWFIQLLERDVHN